MKKAGITNAIIIEVKKGAIIIKPASKERQPNLDISTWDREIKKAIKAGKTPEESLWGNGVSEEV